MELKMIAAVGKNNELGKDNDLIWPIKEDLKFFKNVTTGHTVIMGANTFFSLPKVLPNRTNIVLSQDDITVPEGVILYHDLNKFLSDYKDKDEIVFVIGGGTIYRLFIDKVNEIYLTEIDVVKAPLAFISILETLSGLTPKPSILSVLLGTVVKINVVPTLFRMISYFLP